MYTSLSGAKIANRIRLGFALGGGLLLLTLSGCIRTYVFPSVEVAATAISPTYRLEIENGTAEQLRIDPVTDHDQHFPAQVLEPGQTFGGVLVVVRRLKIGGNPVPQVVDGAYLAVAAAGQGKIRVSANRETACPFCHACALMVDVNHPSWFQQRKKKTKDSPLLQVRVVDCDEPRTLFQHGPDTPES